MEHSGPPRNDMLAADLLAAHDEQYKVFSRRDEQLPQCRMRYKCKEERDCRETDVLEMSLVMRNSEDEPTVVRLASAEAPRCHRQNRNQIARVKLIRRPHAALLHVLDTLSVNNSRI